MTADDEMRPLYLNERHDAQLIDAEMDLANRKTISVAERSAEIQPLNSSGGDLPSNEINVATEPRIDMDPADEIS